MSESEIRRTAGMKEDGKLEPVEAENDEEYAFEME